MTRELHPRKQVVFFSYAIGIAVPVLSIIILRAAPTMYLVLPVILAKITLNLLSIQTTRKKKIVFQLLSSIVCFCFGALIIIGILITPLSHFKIWFSSFSLAGTGGIVSNLFVMLISFFSCFFGGVLLRRQSVEPLTGLLAVILGVATLITQNIIVGIIFASSLLVFIHFYSRSGFIFLSIILIVCLGIGFALFLINGKPQGNEFISRVLHREARRTISQIFPSYPLLLGVPGYGYSMGDDAIGVSPILSPISVFEIEGSFDYHLYLRTETFDFFNGASWGVKDEANRELFKQTGFSPIPPDASQEYLIRVLVDSYLYLPTILTTDYVVINNSSYELMTIPEQRGFRIKPPLNTGDTVILYARNEKKKTELTPAERERYLELPKLLPEGISVMALRLRGNEKSSRFILTFFQQYFNQNYTYTLKPPPTPPGGDTISYFLLTSKKGFCEHFATSFVLLARLSDIPARYVTGFLINPLEPYETSTVVTGLSAHAWAEVWIEGEGWVTWEPTPPFNDLAEMAGISLIESDSYTQAQLRALRKKTPPKKTTQGGETDWQGLLNILFWAGIVICTAAAGFITFVFIRRMINLMHIRKRFLSALKRYIRLCPKEKAPALVGWKAWTRFLIRQAPFLEKKISALYFMIIRIAYGNVRIRKSDFTYLKLLYQPLKQAFKS